MEGSCCLFTDHSGLVPNEPHFQGGQVPGYPGQVPDTPHFRGGQVPGYPGQVPGTPEKQNLTKNLETGLKLNISKKFFQNLLIYNKLEFWEACSNLYLQKKRFRGARNLSTLDRNLSRVDRFLSRVARNLSPLGFLVLKKK